MLRRNARSIFFTLRIAKDVPGNVLRHGMTRLAGGCRRDGSARADAAPMCFFR
jgi:hypothetical protein